MVLDKERDMLHGQVTIMGPPQGCILNVDKVHTLQCGCHSSICYLSGWWSYRWKPFLNQLLLISEAFATYTTNSMSRVLVIHDGKWCSFNECSLST